MLRIESLPRLSLDFSPLSCVTEEGKERVEAYPDILIGHGSSGMVFYGINADTKSPRAIKRLPKFQIQHSDFKKERDVLSDVSHENIVRFHGSFEDDSSFVMVTEYCSGGDLCTELQKGPLDERRAALLVRQMLRGLRALHSHGIFHGDVRPENLVFTTEERDQLKLIDFGSASRISDSNGHRTRKMTANGPYSAPEVVTITAYDAACDIWSLGIVLYAMLGGNPSSENRSPSRLTNISDPCRDFLFSLLKTDPRRRPSADRALNHPWLAFGPLPFGTPPKDAESRRFGWASPSASSSPSCWTVSGDSDYHGGHGDVELLTEPLAEQPKKVVGTTPSSRKRQRDDADFPETPKRCKLLKALPPLPSFSSPSIGSV